MSPVSRRDALRYGAAAAAVVGSGLAAQNLSAPSSAAQPASTDPRDFEVRYRGKTIKGVHAGGVDAMRTGDRPPHQVEINGRKLALMPIELPAAGGGVTVAFISALNHYEPVLIDDGQNRNGLRKLAERAVEVLGDAELTALAGADHQHGR